MPRSTPVRIPPLPEHVVASSADLTVCLDHLAGQSQIAFDTEFVGEDTYRPELCLVQVATAEKLFLIDPYATGPLDGFWNLLTDPNRLVIVHAGREEIRMCRYGVGRPPANVFDVQIAAGLVGYAYPIGYGNLVNDVLGIRTNKGETLTDWRRRPLTPAQERYAYDDVRYLLPIWKRLSDKLKKRGRVDWAAEEFAVAVRRALGGDPGTERWRKVKGLGGLDRRGLAIARSLFQWREDFADRVNRPARYLLRDDLIADIARRLPTKIDDLTPLRGLPRGEAEAILNSVRRAVTSAPDEWPEKEERDHDPPHVALLAQLLGVVLAEFAAREQIAPNMVATTSDLRTLARSRQKKGALPADFPLAHGWRAGSALPELAAVLDGERALRVADPRSKYPIRVEPPTEK
ncbi:MAG TPA: ribonuclease D [Fimbriiglobus sp.]|jgi:ribonuclease D